MKQEPMQAWLREQTDRFPIFVISHNRAGAAPTLNQMRTWSSKDGIHIVVRPGEVATYEDAYPGITVIGTEPNHNVGTARWSAVEAARERGHDTILMLDDDLLWIRYMYEAQFVKGKNIGKEKTAHSSNLEQHADPDLPNRILAGISSVARDVMAKHPNAVLGGAIKQHMSFSEKNHRTKYVLNGGVTPRQLMVWNIARMGEMDIRLDTELFGQHGDDIGLVADILKNDGDCWAMPSFCYDIWAEDVNIHRSLLRSPETAKQMHEMEWDALQQYPIKDYMRTRNSIVDGSFEWADVDWRKLNKARGTTPIIEYWDQGWDLI